SGVCAATIGLTFGGRPALTLALALVWGITVVADSAQFSTAITELSPPAYVGTALTMQTCVGFAITNVSIWLLLPVVNAVGWRWAFAALAIGPPGLWASKATRSARASPKKLRKKCTRATPANRATAVTANLITRPALRNRPERTARRRPARRRSPAAHRAAE